MARTLPEVIEAHLGALTFQSIQFAYQLEQRDARIAELEARLLEARLAAPAPEPAATETPDGQ